MKQNKKLTHKPAQLMSHSAPHMPLMLVMGLALGLLTWLSCTETEIGLVRHVETVSDADISKNTNQNKKDAEIHPDTQNNQNKTDTGIDAGLKDTSSVDGGEPIDPPVTEVEVLLVREIARIKLTFDAENKVPANIQIGTERHSAFPPAKLDELSIEMSVENNELLFSVVQVPGNFTTTIFTLGIPAPSGDIIQKKYKVLGNIVGFYSDYIYALASDGGPTTSPQNILVGTYSEPSFYSVEGILLRKDGTVLVLDRERQDSEKRRIHLLKLDQLQNIKRFDQTPRNTEQKVLYWDMTELPDGRIAVIGGVQNEQSAIDLFDHNGIFQNSILVDTDEANHIIADRSTSEPSVLFSDGIVVQRLFIDKVNHPTEEIYKGSTNANNRGIFEISYGTTNHIYIGAVSKVIDLELSSLTTRTYFPKQADHYAWASALLIRDQLILGSGKAAVTLDAKTGEQSGLYYKTKFVPSDQDLTLLDL